MEHGLDDLVPGVARAVFVSAPAVQGGDIRPEFVGLQVVLLIGKEPLPLRPGDPRGIAHPDALQIFQVIQGAQIIHVGHADVQIHQRVAPLQEGKVLHPGIEDLQIFQGLTF